jgi:4-carboxymuconolactone decarboxylase
VKRSTVTKENLKMARINGVLATEAGDDVAQTYAYSQQGMAQLTGREVEGGIEPIEVYAHAPGLLQAYGAFEYASSQLTGVSLRIRALAELKAATMTNCEYCIDLGSQVARRWGLSDEELLALPSYKTSPLFTDAEKLVLDYAVAVSRTPVHVPDELFEALKQHFEDAQLMQITHFIALENMRGRFNLALGIGAAGFSEGMVCAVPAVA